MACVEPLNTGTTIPIVCFPCSGILDQITIAAQGLSGAPILTPVLMRFISGPTLAGLTAITGIGQTLTVSDYGTSGVIGFSMVSAGSTSASLINVQTGDCLYMLPSGSNAAIASAVITVVVNATQDIRSHYGAFGASAMVGVFTSL